MSLRRALEILHDSNELGIIQADRWASTFNTTPEAILSEIDRVRQDRSTRVVTCGLMGEGK